MGVAMGALVGVSILSEVVLWGVVGKESTRRTKNGKPMISGIESHSNLTHPCNLDLT